MSYIDVVSKNEKILQYITYVSIIISAITLIFLLIQTIQINGQIDIQRNEFDILKEETTNRLRPWIGRKDQMVTGSSLLNGTKLSIIETNNLISQGFDMTLIKEVNYDFQIMNYGDIPAQNITIKQGYFSKIPTYENLSHLISPSYAILMPKEWASISIGIDMQSIFRNDIGEINLFFISYIEYEWHDGNGYYEVITERVNGVWEIVSSRAK